MDTSNFASHLCFGKLVKEDALRGCDPTFEQEVAAIRMFGHRTDLRKKIHAASRFAIPQNAHVGGNTRLAFSLLVSSAYVDAECSSRLPPLNPFKSHQIAVPHFPL